MNALEFQKMIIETFKGEQNSRQDETFIHGFVDGVPILVVQKDNVTANVLDNFIQSIKRYHNDFLQNCIANKQTCGYIIGFSFTDAIKKEIAELEPQGIIVKLVLATDVMNSKMQPKFTLKFNKKDGQVKAINVQNVDHYLWCYPYIEQDDTEDGNSDDESENNSDIFKNAIQTSQGVFVIPDEYLKNEKYFETVIACMGVSKEGITRVELLVLLY